MTDDILTSSIIYYINNSHQIEFAWSIDSSTSARHTAIVLTFDSKPQLTLDFIEQPSQSIIKTLLNRLSVASQLASTISATAIEAGINVFPFNHDSKIKIIGSILKFMIDDDAGKDKARRLIKSILEMDKGDYHILFNNCRDFVKKVFELLRKEPECSEYDEIKFEEEMKKITEEDQEKVQNIRNIEGRVGIGAALVATAFAVGKLFYK